MNLRKAVKNAYYTSVRRRAHVGVFRRWPEDDYEVRLLITNRWGKVSDLRSMHDAQYVFNEGRVIKNRRGPMGSGIRLNEILAAIEGSQSPTVVPVNLPPEHRAFLERLAKVDRGPDDDSPTLGGSHARG